MPDDRLKSAVSDAQHNIFGNNAATAEPVKSYATDAAQTTPADSSEQSVDGLPAVVVHTEPISGSSNVASGPAEIQVTFSKEMADHSWSWCDAWTDSSPTKTDGPSFSDDHKTCSVNVKLEPGKTYGYWINDNEFQNFKDTAGQPAVPYLLIFRTSTTSNPGIQATGSENQRKP